MTRNDYRMLARRIRETAYATRAEPGSGVVVGELVARLCEFYRRTDPAFDEQRFLAHCGLGEPPALR